MKIRHFWRWPVLFTILFGFAQAGSGQTLGGVPPGTSRGGTPPIDAGPAADHACLNAGLSVVRAALRAARTESARPAVLRRLADGVDAHAAQMVELQERDPTDHAAVQRLAARMFMGAEALRSRNKVTRRAGLADLYDALHEFDPERSRSAQERV
ncbi:MAG: hypothetical protein ABI794_12855 [Betaproteobacteria bacterium]